MNWKHFILLLRTMPHLKFKQVTYRLYYILRFPYLPAGETAPEAFKVHWNALPICTGFVRNVWVNGADVRAGTFRFLNQTLAFGQGIDWRAPSMGRLWRYNLHYFDWLHCRDEIGAEYGLARIGDWISHNPSGTMDSWDPFPTSLRLVNWIKFLSRHPRTDGSNEAAHSAHQQALWLESNLEHHILANHLFKNIKALVFCGLFFTGQDADRWRRKGLALLQQELAEQVLPDGAHFELSPMYHSMILEDCLDLYNICVMQPELCVPELVQQLRLRLSDLVAFLRGLCHPDGQIALFNDAAIGIEAPPEALLDYFTRLLHEQTSGTSGSISAYPNAGYFIMEPWPGAKLIVDCGEVGPSYQPGHSHCDALSFELSLNSKRIIVDAGCSRYEDGETRRYIRGNSGHNTLTVDGQNQSEVWGAHRCARRAHPLYASISKASDDSLVFEGAHDGYKRLRGSPVHRRRIAWKGATLSIEDTVEGSGTHTLQALLHLHPGLDVCVQDGKAIVEELGQRIATFSVMGLGALELARGLYCPEFGMEQPCAVLQVTMDQVALPFSGGWLIELDKRICP